MQKLRPSEQALTAALVLTIACLFVLQARVSVQQNGTPRFSFERMNFAFGYGSSSVASSPALECGGGSGADDAMLYNSHCYLLFNSSDKTWSDAKTACASYSGSYLASITSSAEHTQIVSNLLLNAVTFIGLNDIASEGTFVWDNGEAFSYDNWYSGQPDDYGDQNCASLYEPFGFQWDDYNCGIAANYLCEVGSSVCGNATVESGEECDDGDTSSGDGCSSSCTAESGWSCVGTTPTVCSEVCGNGVVTSGEGCDDGNTSAGDGCSASCAEESGWSCSGAPSSCSTTCGDGIVAGGEACDDGNNNDDDACRNSCIFASCGDGVVQADGADGIPGTDDDEACDDSGESATCDDDCSAVACGDQNINQAAGEQCDDGNNMNSDACLNSCALAICGDNYVRVGIEDCDPPGIGTCAANCTEAKGIGITAITELKASSSSSRSGPPPHCGNGKVEPDKGEVCDLGRFNGLSPLCDRWCGVTYCGDGVVQAQTEECEPMQENGMYVAQTCGGRMCAIPACNSEGACTGGCTWVFLPACMEIRSSSSSSISAIAVEFSSTGTGDVFQNGQTSSAASSFRVAAASSASNAQFSSAAAAVVSPPSSAPSPVSTISLASIPQTTGVCGNGIVEAGEQCDNAGRNSNTLPDSCRQNCRLPQCGDKVQDYGEECDDGNDILGDGCTPLCTRSLCGNGVLEPGEECDDGQMNSDSSPDSCSSRCLLPRCGDGIMDASFGEACDQGADNSNTVPDRCRLNCARPHCGDGIKDSSEQCDDGNASNLDACTTSCTIVSCGNGIVDWNETCDDGNKLSGDGCSSICLADSQSFLQWLRDAARLPFSWVR